MLDKAIEYLKKADMRCKGAPWLCHCRSAGMAAFLLAEKIPSLDAELAGSYGMLHDIGRAFGEPSMKINHIFKGYRFLMNEGYPEAARICLTHSFPVQDIKSVTGVWDCTQEDYDFLEQYLQNIEYTLYDRLIQFCDNIALPEGIAILEKRLVDIVRRYGNDSRNLLERWESLFAIKEELETAMGCSVEEVFGFQGVLPVSDQFWKVISI